MGGGSGDGGGEGLVELDERGEPGLETVQRLGLRDLLRQGWSEGRMTFAYIEFCC